MWGVLVFPLSHHKMALFSPSFPGVQVDFLLLYLFIVEPVRDLSWLGRPRVDDEWSGLSKTDMLVLYAAV